MILLGGGHYQGCEQRPARGHRQLSFGQHRINALKDAEPDYNTTTDAGQCGCCDDDYLCHSIRIVCSYSFLFVEEC
jgi:hypothetical protein